MRKALVGIATIGTIAAMAAVAPAASGAPGGGGNKPPANTISVVQFSPNKTALSATEGQVAPVSVVVTRSNSTGTAIFNLSPFDGSAVITDDYVPLWSNPVTIDPGKTSVTVLLGIANDLITEPTETMTLKLSTTDALTQVGKKNSATVTITDNDPCSPLSVDDMTGVEGSSLTFTVSMAAPCTLPVQVHWATGGGTATAGSDYTAASGNVAIASGATSTTFNVATLQDTTDEPDQTFNVTLSAPVNTTIADGAGVGTITDDDAAPGVTMSDNPTATEGSDLVYTIALSALSEKVASGTFETWPGNAADSRYTAVVSAPWSIPAGVLTTTVNVPTTDDGFIQSDVTVWGHLLTAVNAVIDTSFVCLGGFPDYSCGSGLLTNDAWSYGTLQSEDVPTTYGFESGDLTGWSTYTDGDAPVASVSSASANTGTYSALLGTPDPSCVVYEPLGVSSVYRDVAIPAAGTTSLSFWVNEVGDGFADSQFAQVQPAGGGAALATIFDDGAASSGGVWIPKTFDLTPYAGSTVRLLFGVYQDNLGCASGMYLDDVQISTTP